MPILRFETAQKELLLARHGKAEHNVAMGGFAGGRIDTNLSSIGIEETKFLAKEILEDGGCDIIFCSQLKRSKQTAEILAKEFERAGKKVGIQEIDGLEEVDVGEFTGKFQSDVEKLYLKEAKPFYEGQMDKLDFPGGENFDDVKKRLEKVLIKAEESDYKKILLVGHAIFSRIVLSIWYPDKPELWKPVAYPHDRIVCRRLI
jgi:broad specificity phosphatase PhoE